MKKKRFKAIFAVNKQNIIGTYGKGMPWHQSSDLKRFKEITTGGIIVMGRTTWDAIGRKILPNRVNIVITTQPEKYQEKYPDVKFISSINDIPDRSFIIGGAKLLYECLPLIEKIYLTVILHDFENPEKYIRLNNTVINAISNHFTKYVNNIYPSDKDNDYAWVYEYYERKL